MSLSSSALPSSIRRRAEAAQQAASDPAVSAFVSASAGSGKTKVLTDRLLRLMLDGARPEGIQCLTFTKAAAAEMALRLQTRLGEWVTLPDDALDSRLNALCVAPSPDSRARARTLFAHVLDAPGGMRISTIHAFCQSLLHQFPLEAALSPHFRLAEDSDFGLALDQAREDVMGAPDSDMQDSIDMVAGFAAIQGFSTLLDALLAKEESCTALFQTDASTLWQALRRRLGAQAADTAAALAQAAAAMRADRALRDALGVIAEKGSDTIRLKAAAMLDFLALPPEIQVTQWEEQCPGFFLTQKGEPRAARALCNDKLAALYPSLREPLAAQQNQVLAVLDHLRALRLAELSFALWRTAAPVLQLWRARADAAGQLRYDDLIQYAARLLVDPGAAWVLYKLDGGLDHLLLDEAQDTSPAQWRIADALTAEFLAGHGAREGLRRGVFAVGDPKQSIYSFQGADPAAFDQWRACFRQRAQQAGQDWRDVPLDVSFRSTTPVLALVDAVFADPHSAGGVVDQGQTLRHFPDRADHAGWVELWPLTPENPAEPLEPWRIPDRNLAMRSPIQTLADTLAGWIAARTDGSVLLESRGTPLHPGDILVLVRRRGAFDRALVKALKARGVPVAGLDRMKLTAQPAVQDLLSLLDVLLLPEDDLSLACVLTSPLGGLTDSSLMDLAMGRSGTLWSTLYARAADQPDWQAALDFLTPLLARVDYAPPHALLSEALGLLGGRARLLRRLGPDSAEPVDELLSAALRYAESHPPGVQGFLHWIRRSGAEVKRQPEEAGDTVRIMTVHGAKGLQAPLVILPDTTALPDDDRTLLWLPDPETGLDLPVWSPRQDMRCQAAVEAGQAERRRMVEEYNRLLYVALTRAEDGLLICGWQTRSMPESCWYQQARRGFLALGAEAAPFEQGWEGERLFFSTPQTTAPVAPHTPRALSVVSSPLPAWAGEPPDWRAAPPPPEPARPRPLAPSRPDSIRLGPVPAAVSPLRPPIALSGLQRGVLAHRLLQHLPALPPDQREPAARVYLHRMMAEDEAEPLIQTILDVLSHPALAVLFGPDSRAEQPISGWVEDRVVQGVIDRLAVTPEEIWIADVKTTRAPPATPETAPVLYLRQMAAYESVVRRLYPDKRVRCVLIWTETMQVMEIPAGLLVG